MAKFARTNGDLQPVVNFDNGAYAWAAANTVVSGAVVQPQGPFLAFYTVTGAGHLTGTQVSYVIKAAEQLATVHMYEFTTGGTNDTVAMALYPVNAWNATDLQANIRAALTSASVANAVTVTNSATFDGDTYLP